MPEIMKQNEIFKLAELFCGPGGLSLGAMTAIVSNPKGKIYKVNSGYNAVRNVLKRYNDSGIGLYTPFMVVKSIFKRCFQAIDTVQPGPENSVFYSASQSRSELAENVKYV